MTGIGRTNRGKWSQAGVPKKGWSCDDIEDKEDSRIMCEMCEDQEARFVHHMSHPDYPTSLAVGCVCAEHMENDYVRPKRREARLRNAASRRKSWRRRKWMVSAAGNPYLNAQGYNITVYERGDAFGVIVRHRETGQSKIGRKRFPSERAAKDAGLDALVWAEEHLT